MTTDGKGEKISWDDAMRTLRHVLRRAEQERDRVAEEEARRGIQPDKEAPDEELVELLADMVARHCKAEEGLDSAASSTNAAAMRALAKRGLLEIEYDVGRRVIGHWKEKGDVRAEK